MLMYVILDGLFGFLEETVEKKNTTNQSYPSLCLLSIAGHILEHAAVIRQAPKLQRIQEHEHKPSCLLGT